MQANQQKAKIKAFHHKSHIVNIHPGGGLMGFPIVIFAPSGRKIYDRVSYVKHIDGAIEVATNLIDSWVEK